MKTEGKIHSQILQRLQPYCNPPALCVWAPCSSLQGQCPVPYYRWHLSSPNSALDKARGFSTTISTFSHKLAISQSPREREGAKGECQELWFSSSTCRSGTTETLSPRSNSCNTTHDNIIKHYCLYLLGWHCLFTVKSYRVSSLLHTNKKLWFTFYFLIPI